MTLSGREVGSTVLLGERSPHRGVAFLAADLAALEAHARSSGATVNDALLAAVASGYRAVLHAAERTSPHGCRFPFRWLCRVEGHPGIRSGSCSYACRLASRTRTHASAHRRPDPHREGVGAAAGHARVHARPHGCAHHGPRRSPAASRCGLRHECSRAGGASPARRRTGRGDLASAVLAANVRLASRLSPTTAGCAAASISTLSACPALSSRAPWGRNSIALPEGEC